MEKRNGLSSISQKITKPIVSIALACSLAIGIVGVICIAAVNAVSQQIYTRNLVPLTPIYKAQADFQTSRSDMKSMVLNAALKIPGEDYEAQAASLLSDMKMQLDSYAKDVSSAQEKQDYQAILQDLDTYREQVNTIESSIKAGRLTEAVALLNGDNSKLSTDLKGRIGNEFVINTKQASQRNGQARTVFLISIFTVLAFAAAFIAAAVKISRRISDGISAPIRKMAAAAESLAAGDLNVDLDIHTTDETGILAESFQKIVSSLKLLQADVTALIGEALEGRLDARADTSKHKGGYKAIIEGVNRMFDTIKEPLDVASGFINRLADGEHQSAIENTYHGYYATLIDNLNKVLFSITVLESEAARLAEAGLNGDLTVRGDEQKLKGAYAQIIHGVNQTFDAIKEPLDAASVFIGNLADGQGQKDIENTYRGYYASLIDNLNSVRHSLAYLITETSRLNKAGQEGDLNVRGDAGSLKGGFADIINGFNHTLQAIVAPLNEAMSVLTNMTVNDYSKAMAGSYNGMLGEFAASVNEVLAALKRVESIFGMIARGDFSLLETYRKIGKRSENDNMVPSTILMMQTLVDLTEQTRLLSEAAQNGELDRRGDGSKFEGGYASIINGMNRTMIAFSEPIEETANVLRDFSAGDLTVEITGDYKGEYGRIKSSVNTAVSSLNVLLSSIMDAAGQVSVGSKQVSDASQSLSQGAVEQASSIEELTSSVSEIAAQTKKNAENASQANVLSAGMQEAAVHGAEKMDIMLESIRDINESSAGISKIIKAIDDIAFQTNILALNAAVEAARAGQHGKGFAVVAEEVRNLAAKSADAAKDTTAMIESSIKKSENGSKIAHETAEMLNEIVEKVKKSTELAHDIASASGEQATSITQIDQGISQVSTVVQTNSATAEESAASSEELSGQAETLMQMVGKFKLKNIR